MAMTALPPVASSRLAAMPDPSAAAAHRVVVFSRAARRAALTPAWPLAPPDGPPAVPVPASAVPAPAAASPGRPDDGVPASAPDGPGPAVPASPAEPAAPGMPRD